MHFLYLACEGRFSTVVAEAIFSLVGPYPVVMVEVGQYLETWASPLGILFR